MNSKQVKILAALFETPTRRDLCFAEIQALLRALGARILQREGSRVRITLDRFVLVTHAPHGTTALKPYQIRDLRQLLTDAGVQP